MFWPCECVCVNVGVCCIFWELAQCSEWLNLGCTWADNMLLCEFQRRRKTILDPWISAETVLYIESGIIHEGVCRFRSRVAHQMQKRAFKMWRRWGGREGRRYVYHTKGQPWLDSFLEQRAETEDQKSESFKRLRLCLIFSLARCTEICIFRQLLVSFLVSENDAPHTGVTMMSHAVREAVVTQTHRTSQTWLALRKTFCKMIIKPRNYFHALWRV